MKSYQFFLLKWINWERDNYKIENSWEMKQRNDQVTIHVIKVLNKVLETTLCTEWTTSEVKDARLISWSISLRGTLFKPRYWNYTVNRVNNIRS